MKRLILKVSCITQHFGNNNLGKIPFITSIREVVFHYYNARYHVLFRKLQKLIGFRWDALNHPPYSPNISPSNYYPFDSLEHSIRERKFVNVSDIKNHPGVFESKPEEF